MKQRFARITPKQWYWLLTILSFAAIVFGILLRAYRIDYPNKQVFDEVYFPVFAQDYIDHISFYDVHPPFGKFAIALGMLLRGDLPPGWRMMPLIFGIANIGLFAHLWWVHFKDRVGAWIVAVFIALDGMFIAYSRTGLMDGILTFFTFITYLSALRLDSRRRVFWMATLFGVTLAIKWPTAALVVPILFFAWRQKRIPEVIYSFFWSFIVYMAITALGQYLTGAENPLREAWNWNFSAAEYHHTIGGTHPWGSKWWEWPLMIRPVLFLYDSAGNGLYNVMTTVGNPLVWWGSTLLVLISTFLVVVKAWFEKAKGEQLSPFFNWLYRDVRWSIPMILYTIIAVVLPTSLGHSILQMLPTDLRETLTEFRFIPLTILIVWVCIRTAARQKDHPLVPLLLGFYAFWLPWAGIQRVLFQYHYFPAYGFAMLIATWWLVQLWKLSRWQVVAIVAAVIAVGVYFAPFGVGWWPLSQQGIRLHEWLTSWL